jgi:hypothetical protein
MIITRKHLQRRTFLRGIGAAVALPWLDAMVPAFAAPSQIKPPVRLVWAYTPNGTMMEDWTPKATGRDFEFTRILKPLEPYREDLLVLTGLHHHEGKCNPGDHAGAAGWFLTGITPKRTTGADLKLGISADQVVAQAIGSRTSLPSLELCCEPARPVGNCDGGFACAYIHNMSWRDDHTPVPPEADPRGAFERLFGGFDTDPDPKIRARINQNRGSLLDVITQQTQRLTASLGTSDRSKVDEYMTSLRDIEKRIQRIESDNKAFTTKMEKPSGIPSGFVEHARLMNDLLAVALQADVTRVATLIYAKEASFRSYPELGFGDAHHPISHHRGKPELIEKIKQIEVHHMTQFASLVKTLKSMPEGDGTVLDHSMIVYGSAMSDPNPHAHFNVPCVILGSGNGALKSGRHVVYPEDTSQMNLWLALLDKMGVEAEHLGVSTGKVEHLSDI